MPRFTQPAWAAFLFLECAASLAASLQISPVSIQLAGPENGKVVTLRNDGDEPIHAQVRTFVWDQSDEEDKLTPTRDLIASPPIAEVPAGGQQVIRVIRANAAPVAQERAYRLIIDELPPDGGDKQSAVQFRFRYSLPLFISPRGEASTPKLQWSVVERNGKAYLRVQNDGDIHAQLSTVSLKTSDKDVRVSGGLLGYVLPGRVRSWILPDAASAMHGKTGEVSATVNGASMNGSLSNPAAP
ncbi:molecular chaperone [Caballeronia sp. TF1N1]|uniref:fimbrial biogenesis chaperone n=1 Tax=Caballeronia sp. TF1N1 TaxID=2878153 RepID=UPI001FD1AA11|nr:molecular chaperone [Caballeronia sp. TF1N1]